MSTSEDGTDIFEITDFTTASEFERFVAHLEEIIHEWKLTTSPEYKYEDEGFDINAAQWQEVYEEICFVDFPFTVTHYSIKERKAGSSSAHNKPPKLQMPTEDSPKRSSYSDHWSTPLKELHFNRQDFPSKVHCLCRWYGLTSFVVVSPKSYSLTEESRLKMVLSAVMVASQNTSCAVPIFVHSLEASRMYYMGHLSSPGSTTSFEMVHMNRVPERFRLLTGLLEVFKGKLNLSVDPQPKAVVSIRLTCVLQDWEKYVFDWPQTPAGLEGDVESPAIGWTKIDRLPFGTCENPIENLHLYAMWPNMSEDVLMENEVHSELEPKIAPAWSVRVTMAKDIKGLLTESLQKFAELCESSETFEQAIGTRQAKESDYEITNALEKLAEPQTRYNIPSFSKVTKAVSNTRLRLSSRAQQDSPIPFDLLHKILLHVFPDAHEDDTKTEVNSSGASPKLKEIFKYYKTAPVGSPIYNLAVSCCLVNYAFGGLKAVAHLWHEFVLEMRYRLDNSILLPGLERGLPNLSQGILYQKLQMLNCCIERKLNRESQQNLTPESHVVENLSAESKRTGSASADPPVDSNDGEGAEGSSTDDDDEFFDCEVEESDSKEDGANTTVCEESVDIQPQGRLSKLGDLRLTHNDEHIYIPVTQEPSPMTEDMLAEHADMLTRLGTSAEGASLRARLQSASLISDMESFKAANPGCVLEDFVRWYSPRDYTMESVVDPETGDTIEKGCLSTRMLVPGNMWQEAWTNAKPVAAKRQKRLFDDTKEAEKVLHFLSNLTPAKVVLYLLPMTCQSAIGVIKEQGEELMPSIVPLVESLTSRLENMTRNSSQRASTYSDCINSIHSAELLISRARSLYLKFACDGANKDNEDVKKFVLDLMAQEEVKVIGAGKSPVGKTLTEMFKEAKISQGDQRQHQQHNVQFNKPNTIATPAINSLFPKPVEKEYILRAVAPRPAPYSQPLPQRMYCTVNGHEYRLCGAFSSDSTFQ